MEFKKRGIMLDCSRDAVRTVETVKRFADVMEKCGFNMLMLYTEDTYEIDNRPYFGYMRGRYSRDELREIDAYCAQKGIELVPCIQTLAHLNGICRWSEFSDIIDIDDILLVGDDRTYELIDDMLRTVSETFSTRRVHIGMDEAGRLGMGKYLEKNGFKSKSEIMSMHLDRVSEIAKKYSLEPIMWSDMLVENNVSGSDIPDGITPVYWDYYSTDKSNYDTKINRHKKLGKPFWFAGGIWTWTGFVPHNLYSINASAAAIKSCAEHGVENVFFTMWGDNGAETSPFAVLPAMYSISCFLNGVFDKNEISDGFCRTFGMDIDSYLAADIPEINYLDDNRDRVVDPDKYMLYCDPFIGIYDTATDSSRNELYRNAQKRLESLQNHSKWGYIFRTLASLCRVLSVKNDIGIRARSAYRSRDMQELKKVAADFDVLHEYLVEFYESFKNQWYTENKPFGFEIHESRIGGIMLRVKGCKDRIADFVDGKIDCISELEEEILDVECKPNGGKRELWQGSWVGCCVNIMN